MRTPAPDLLSVSYTKTSQKAAAEAFADTHQLVCQPLAKAKSELTLVFDELKLELVDLGHKMSIDVDFLAGSLGHRKKYGGGKGQLIARAIGVKQGKPIPTVLDATAGLAKDSYVLACLGCPVTMLERSPVVAALVENGIYRASLNTEFDEIIKQGFVLHQCDAFDYINNIQEHERPDVIYLDPMYPERKKSASVKKNMQMLQKLLGKDLDTDAVLEAALNKARLRVVVKRPKGAPELSAEKKPNLSYESKTTRYDTYIVH